MTIINVRFFFLKLFDATKIYDIILTILLTLAMEKLNCQLKFKERSVGKLYQKVVIARERVVKLSTINIKRRSN